MNSPVFTSALGITILACASIGPVMATQYNQNASGVCKSALPAFDGNIRNRPLAVRNEGNAVAFVSCSMIDKLDGETTTVGVMLKNTNAGPEDISCTFVNGLAAGSPEYFSKTQTYAAGQNSFIAWGVSDNEGANFQNQINFSCALPPGTELQFVAFIPTVDL